MIDRIVVINDLSRPTGGASLLAIQSARGFASRGHRVTFISGDRPSGETDSGIDHVSLGSDRLLAGNPVQSFVNGIYNRKARAMIEAWIAANDTPRTIYHLHGWMQILSPAVFGALEKVWDRVIVTAHDFFLSCPNGAFFDFQREEACTRRPLGADCLTTACDRRGIAHKAWRTGRQVPQARKFAGRGYPKILLIHGAMTEYFRRSGIPASQMSVLPNPVTPFCENPVDAAANSDILFVGRIEQTKGIDLAAEACRRAKVRLVAVGDGALLQEMKSSYPQMEFVGRLAHHEIADRAARARMLVMPSRHMEPFGLSAVEALWSAIPVALSRNSLIADDVVSSGSGIAFDPTDIGEFAAQLARIAVDDAAVAQMSRQARLGTRHLASDPEAWLDGLLDAYEELVEEECSRVRSVNTARPRSERQLSFVGEK